LFELSFSLFNDPLKFDSPGVEKKQECLYGHIICPGGGKNDAAGILKFVRDGS